MHGLVSGLFPIAYAQGLLPCFRAYVAPKKLIVFENTNVVSRM
jgi:hypothetical protein